MSLGQSFTVVLHTKSIAGGAAGPLTRTLVKLEVCDQSRTAVYQKTFAYQLEGRGFGQAVSASARFLPGDNLTGMLITYTRQPAPTGAEQSWQVFGFRNGRLAVFDPPGADSALNTLTQQFTGIGMNGATTMSMRSLLDSVELRAWTGNFYVIVPLRVDWRAGRLTVGQRCLASGGGPGLHEVGCDMRVEAERVPSNAEFQFARVFPTPEEQAGIVVQHVVIAKEAEVQLLKAKAIVTSVLDEDVMRIQFSDLWLNVLIDNNTGNECWVHGEQDLKLWPSDITWCWTRLSVMCRLSHVALHPSPAPTGAEAEMVRPNLEIQSVRMRIQRAGGPEGLAAIVSAVAASPTRSVSPLIAG